MDAIVRVGIDLAAVDEVADSIRRFGNRYTDRVFTAGELAASEGDELTRSRSLAARFAAKEATIKALGLPPGRFPGWPSIEVQSTASGSVRLVLHEEAAQMSGEAGIESWSVSLTHQGNLAAAVVVGIGSSPQFQPECEPADTGIGRSVERG